MENILNITNGDCAVKTMQQASIPGAFLPWRDVLHDGPVPEGLALDELSKIRAQFIIDQGWGTPENIKNSFIERDDVIKSFEKYEKIILWFEHDLYDQLQLLQILDWFSQQKSTNTKLSIICSDQYLGMVSPEQMKNLFQYETPITDKHLQLSVKAWSAFRSTTPEKWHALFQSDTSALPFLSGAIKRLLEEYPDCNSGLSRTAQIALKIISQGEKRPGKVFHLYQETEERRFLGDSSFWAILYQLLESSPPLLKLPEGLKLTLPTSPDQELSITAAGKNVLAGKKNWLEMVELDRWIGGVHLTANDTWCWNSNSGTLIIRN